MSARAELVETLKRKRPEWSPWLAVVDEAAREAGTSAWDHAVPEASLRASADLPLLAGATVAVDDRTLGRFVERLAQQASRVPALGAITPVLGQIEPDAVFRASVCQDFTALPDSSTFASSDMAGAQAVLALVAVPFLHACARRWRAAVSPGWEAGHCPVCGAWPAFAELRGIERTRYLRCGRCGGEWFGQVLHCAYCGTRDHDQLAALVPDKPGATGAVDACHQCRGYVKVFARLQACAPDMVMLEDLRTADLDVAAIDQGFCRPSSAGCQLDITVQTTRTRRRLFAWNG